VSSIDNRLKKLQGERPQRCENCLPWGDELRISYHHSDGSEKEPTSGPPERCERCGYEPPHIILRETHEAARL
jgi:hypothetical protein